MSIQEHLNKIRNAVYGREVRESIAKGIETAYDDASEKDNANMEVKMARGKNDTLNERLDGMDKSRSNLSNTFDNKLTSKRDKHVAIKSNELDTSSEANKIQPINISDELMEMFSPAGSVSPIIPDKGITKEKLADGAVTSDKLGFPSVAYIGVSYGKDDISLYDVKGEDSKITFGEVTLINVQMSDGSQVQSETIPKGKEYIFDNTKRQSLIMNLSTRELSLVLTEDVPVNSVNLLRHQKNMGFVGGYFYETPRGEKNLTDKAFLFTPDLPPNFDFENRVIELTRPRIVHGKEFIEVSESLVTLYMDDLTTNYGIIMYNKKEKTFRLENNSGAFKRMADDWLILGIYHSGNEIVYMPGDYLINGEKRYEKAIRETHMGSENKFHMSGNFDGLFKSKALEDLTATLPAMQANEVYNMYDELVDSHPDTIKRNLLGYASDEFGGEDTNLPIYEYVFINPNKTSLSANTNDIPSSPKVLIQAGTHGNEKGNALSTYYFFEQLVNDWGNNEELYSMKANVLFKVIPIINPYGFNNDTRENARGVDLNRNYEYRYDDSSGEANGTEALSELESRISSDWMESNKDALLYIDYHNSIGGTPSYIVTEDEKAEGIYISALRRVSMYWKDKYYPTEAADKMFGGVITPWSYGLAYQQAKHITKIPLAFALESGTIYGGILYNKESLEKGTEILTNTILSALSYSKK